MINHNFPLSDAMGHKTDSKACDSSCRTCMQSFVTELCALRQQQALHEIHFEKLLQIHESRIIRAVISPSPAMSENAAAVPYEREVMDCHFVALYQQEGNLEVISGSPDGCGPEATPAESEEVPKKFLARKGFQESTSSELHTYQWQLEESTDGFPKTRNDEVGLDRSFPKRCSEEGSDGRKASKDEQEAQPILAKRASVAEMLVDLKRASVGSMSFDNVKEEEEQPRGIRSRLQKLLENKRFDYFVGIMIMFNAATIGVQTDFALSHMGEAEPPSFRTLDFIFTAFFHARALHAHGRRRAPLLFLVEQECLMECVGFLHRTVCTC